MDPRLSVLPCSQAEKMVLAVGDCVQFREEVRSTLAEVVEGQKEAQAEAVRILDSQTVRDAQQLLLGRQVGGEEEFCSLCFFLPPFFSFFWLFL